jgi:hypothetical protein
MRMPLPAIDLYVVPTLTFGCPVCFSGGEPWSTTAVVVRGNHASDGGVASAADRLNQMQRPTRAREEPALF